MGKNLIVLLGPTGVGKTDLSIGLAKWLGSPIVSSDSRQVYREMCIGTAVPSQEQLRQVPHFFIQCRSITENFTSGMFENEALLLLDDLFRSRDTVLLSGGSGLYIDALCQGIDAVPGPDPLLRQRLMHRLEEEGPGSLLEELKTCDPLYYKTVDHRNLQRIVRALEVCIGTGTPYSALRTGDRKERDFEVVKIGLTRPREELYGRINRRVREMMEAGLEDEARRLYPFRDLNALQTVGYKELFDYFDGRLSLEKAVELIQRNTRRYAKKQMTWFRRDPAIMWFSPDRQEEVASYLRDVLGK